MSTGSSSHLERTKPSLIVVGTGIQWRGQTTEAAARAIERADCVLFAVTDAWAAAWLRERNPNAKSFDYPRDGRYRAEIYEAMVRDILAALDAGQNVCAVFYGSPSWLTQPAHLAVRRARERGFAARMLPGVSSVECLLSELGLDAGRGGLTVFEATDYLKRERPIDTTVQLVLCQIALIDHRRTGDADTARVQRGLQRLQARLLRAYSRDHEVVVYEASSHPLVASRVTRVPLGALEACAVSELSTLYVPPITPARQDAWSVAVETSPRSEGSH